MDILTIKGNWNLSIGKSDNCKLKSRKWLTVCADLLYSDHRFETVSESERWQRWADESYTAFKREDMGWGRDHKRRGRIVIWTTIRRALPQCG